MHHRRLVVQVVAFTPDGKHVYVTNNLTSLFSGGYVLVIKTANRSVVATIPVGTNPTGVAFTPDGTHAYVVNDTDSGTVSVIATATNTAMATVPVDRPVGVAVSPNGQDVYVSKEGHNKVRVIATATNTKVAAIPVGRFPMGLAIGP